MVNSKITIHDSPFTKKMAEDERKLCVVCAWRATCQKKYSMPDDSALHCIDFVRDVTLNRLRSEEEKGQKEEEEKGLKDESKC